MRQDFAYLEIACGPAASGNVHMPLLIYLVGPTSGDNNVLSLQCHDRFSVKLTTPRRATQSLLLTYRPSRKNEVLVFSGSDRRLDADNFLGACC